MPRPLASTAGSWAVRVTAHFRRLTPPSFAAQTQKLAGPSFAALKPHGFLSLLKACWVVRVANSLHLELGAGWMKMEHSPCPPDLERVNCQESISEKETDV